jgi:hypothetical protein
MRATHDRSARVMPRSDRGSRTSCLVHRDAQRARRASGCAVSLHRGDSGSSKRKSTVACQGTAHRLPLARSADNSAGFACRYRSPVFSNFVYLLRDVVRRSFLQTQRETTCFWRHHVWRRAHSPGRRMLGHDPSVKPRSSSIAYRSHLQSPVSRPAIMRSVVDVPQRKDRENSKLASSIAGRCCAVQTSTSPTVWLNHQVESACI